MQMTRTVWISERLYRAIKIASKKNKRTIRAQAEYWIELGLQASEQSSERVILDQKLAKSCYIPFSPVEHLILALRLFAFSPSKEKAQNCRQLIASFDLCRAKSVRLTLFLDKAYRAVARPYKAAPDDIDEAIKWFLEAD